MYLSLRLSSRSPFLEMLVRPTHTINSLLTGTRNHPHPQTAAIALSAHGLGSAERWLMVIRPCPAG